MRTPEFELHRTIVLHSDSSTGEVAVKIPALLGSSVSVNVPTNGLILNPDGTWEVPAIGDTPFIAVSHDRTKFFWAGSPSTSPSSYATNHGNLTGLADDDHTQYLLANGTRDAAYIGFDTTTPHAVTEGQIAWNDDEGTIDIGMHGGNVVLQSGQEVVYYVKNQTGSDIPDGTVVRFDGSLGSSGRLKVAPFLGDKTYKSAYIMGVTTETIPDGEDGYVTHFGKVRGLDTTTDSEGNTLVDGDLLYASATVAGGYTKNEPAAPNNRVLLAAVVHAHAHQGTLFVRPTFVTDLLENERVNAPTISDNDVLVYNGTTGVFENEQFDHGGLSGLSDDDHTQYLLADGTRDADTLTVNGDFSVVGGSGSSVSLRSANIATAVDDGGTAMGIMGGAKVYTESLSTNTTISYSSDGGATGGISPSTLSYNVDARRAGAIAIVSGTIDINAATTGYSNVVFELEVNGARQSDQGIISEGLLGTGRLTLNKTWIVSLPTDSTTLLNLHIWKTSNSGSVVATGTHSSLHAVVFG